MKKVISLFLCVFAFSAGNVLAQQVPITKDLPAPLQLALQSGLTVEKQFAAEGGLTGWIVSDGPGRNMVVFTSADGSVAIAGTMLSAKGENLTQKYIDEHSPKIDYNEAWAKVEEHAAYAVEKEGAARGNVIYVFADPNCAFCHLAWRALQPYVKDGLEVRWIPVAFLREDSMNKSADMLMAEDQTEGVREVQARVGTAGFKTENVPVEIRQKVEANNRLMAELGFMGTPAILYKNAEGAVQSSEGMPTLTELPTITGMPEKPQTDPELARFR